MSSVHALCLALVIIIWVRILHRGTMRREALRSPTAQKHQQPRFFSSGNVVSCKVAVLLTPHPSNWGHDTATTQCLMHRATPCSQRPAATTTWFQATQPTLHSAAFMLRTMASTSLRSSRSACISLLRVLLASSASTGPWTKGRLVMSSQSSFR